MKAQSKWALAGASVLLIGVLGYAAVQQTDAAWRSSAQAGDGATITTGKLELLADETTALDLEDFEIIEGGSGDTATAALEISNGGDVGLSYNLTSVAVNATSGADAPPLKLRVAQVANEAACSGAGSGTTLKDAGLPWTGAALGNDRHLDAPGGAKPSEWLCLTMTIDSGAQKGESATVLLTFQAEVDR